MDPIFNDIKFQEILDNIVENLNISNKYIIDDNLSSLIDTIISSINEDFKNPEEFIKISANDKKEILEELKKLIVYFLKVKKDDLYQIIVFKFYEIYNKKCAKNLKIKFRLNKEDQKKIEKKLERMSIYEEYKAINSHRIVGETKLENFVNNICLKGFSKAMKYENISEEELKQYGKDLIRELDKTYKINKGKKGFNR